MIISKTWTTTQIVLTFELMLKTDDEIKQKYVLKELHSDRDLIVSPLYSYPNCKTKYIL